MPEDSGITGAVRSSEHGQPGSIQIPYPKFDLGKTPLQFNRPAYKIYATIDRNGEQRARAIPVPSIADTLWTKREVERKNRR